MNPQGQAGPQGANPFMAMLQQMQAKRGGAQAPNPMTQHSIAQPPQPPQLPQVPGMTDAGTGGGAKQPIIENSTTPGQNPGSTDSLIKALSALNSVITDADDPEEVQMVRQIIVMLQQLIQRDQHKQGGKDSALGQAQQSAQGFPQNLQAPGGLGAQPQGPQQ